MSKKDTLDMLDRHSAKKIPMAKEEVIALTEALGMRPTSEKKLITDFRKSTLRERKQEYSQNRIDWLKKKIATYQSELDYLQQKAKQ